MELNIEIGVCRCCLTNGAGFKRLSREYDWMGEKEVYADMLRECFDLVLLQPEEAASMLICEICITRLRDSSNFKKQVVYSEKMFVQRLNTEGKKPSVQLKLERFKHEAEEGDGEGPSDRFESHFFEDDDDNDSSDDTKIVQVKPEPSTSTDALESGDDDEPLSSLSTGLKRKSATESAPAAPSKIRKIAPKAPNTVVGKRLTNIQLKVMPRATSKATVQQKAGVKVAVPVKAGVKGPAKIAVPLKTGTGVKVVTKLGVPLRLNVPQKAGQKMPPLKAGQKMPPQKTGQKMPPLKIQAQKPGQKMPLRLGPINRPLKITMKSSSTVAAQKGNLGRKPQPPIYSKILHPGKDEAVHLSVAVLKHSNATPFDIRGFRKIRCYFNCFEDFDPVSLKKHTEEKHFAHIVKAVQWINKNALRIDIANFKCNICHQPMSDIDTFETHISTKHDIRTYKNDADVLVPYILSNDTYECQLCKKAFSDLKTIDSHMGSTHFPLNVCEACGSAFMTIKYFKHHQLSHAEKKFSCEVCDQPFINQTLLKSHVNYMHKGIHRHTCPFCPERFNDHYKRLVHMAEMHNAERPPQPCCPICGKEFNHPCSVLGHVKIMHQKSFVCPTCGDRFGSKERMARHVRRTHTGERLQCEVCSSSYAGVASLQRHYRAFHPERKGKYFCSVCGKICGSRWFLKEHKNIEHAQ